MRGDGRELYKTPVGLIRKIVADLLDFDKTLLNFDWVDPCAGDGRWESVISEFGIPCKSYDISPLSENVSKRDFLQKEPLEGNIFYIGNPPFSIISDFVYESLSQGRSCYFLGGSQILTGGLSKYARMIHRFEGFEGNQTDRRSKAIFEDTLGNDILVWCCGGLFDTERKMGLRRHKSQKENSFRTSIKCWCEDSKRIRVIK